MVYLSITRANLNHLSYHCDQDIKKKYQNLYIGHLFKNIFNFSPNKLFQFSKTKRMGGECIDFSFINNIKVYEIQNIKL